MHPDLERLLELQTKDLALLDTDIRLKGIADELAALDTAMAGAREEAEAAQRRLEEGVKKREELEKTIEAQRAQQEKRRSRIEQVRTAREVQALMTEMDLARSVVARSESDWVKASDLTSQQEGQLKEAQERMVALESDQSGERARLAEQLDALRLEREAALAAREESAALVERTLRARYDRLWSSRFAVVVVALRGDACGACFTSIPRNRRSQIRAGTHIDTCEACGVILYSTNAEE
ncbi:MAG TPA: C4-type zinc ribbon domain-containing protein [Gemmatimonadales bacterium]|nr:C4-type zinc ribbon domain-containing protein [Gemmatimonadales bacterium]